MVTGPDVEHDHGVLERELGAAMGHTHHIQPIVGLEYPADRGR